MRSRAAVATKVAIDVVLGRACLTRILGIELAIIRQGATLDSGIDSDHHVHVAFHLPLSSYTHVQTLVCGLDGRVVLVESFDMM